jgi:hypothetical protein
MGSVFLIEGRITVSWIAAGGNRETGGDRELESANGVSEKEKRNDRSNVRNLIFFRCKGCAFSLFVE